MYEQESTDLYIILYKFIYHVIIFKPVSYRYPEEKPL